jgi:hypothetical protein
MIHSRIPSLRAAATIAFSESFLHELREQSLSLRGGMSSQGQSPKLVLASWGPQGTAAT